VVKSKSDEEVRLYYKPYEGLSIGDKYLCVVVKFKKADAFIITAYFTDSIKKGDIIWKK
jgi:molybdopterin synthase catalytic subunit